MSGSVYQEFDKIIVRSYEPEEIEACEDWADEMFHDLDFYVGTGLEINSASSNFSIDADNIPFDFEKEVEDWDFPDPPEFLR